MTWDLKKLFPNYMSFSLFLQKKQISKPEQYIINKIMRFQSGKNKKKIQMTWKMRNQII